MEKITKNIQLILLIIILVSTIIAVGIEIYTMFVNSELLSTVTHLESAGSTMPTLLPLDLHWRNA